MKLLVLLLLSANCQAQTILGTIESLIAKNSIAIFQSEDLTTSIVKEGDIVGQYKIDKIKFDGVIVNGQFKYVTFGKPSSQIVEQKQELLQSTATIVTDKPTGNELFEAMIAKKITK